MSELDTLRKARTALDGLYEGFLHNTEAGCEAWGAADGFAICSEIDALLAAAPAPTVSGEPVAWQRMHPSEGWLEVRPEDIEHYHREGQDVRPLYTHPAPARAEALEEPDMLIEGRKYEDDRKPDLIIRGEPFYSGAQFRAAYRHGYDFARALAGEKP